MRIYAPLGHDAAGHHTRPFRSVAGTVAATLAAGAISVAHGPAMPGDEQSATAPDSVRWALLHSSHPPHIEQSTSTSTAMAEGWTMLRA
jgi:hypothetical protein